VGGLLSRRRRIRASRPLLQVLNEIPLVDQHAHGLPRAHPVTLDDFRGLFSESADPRQWPHVATALTYRRAIGELAAFLDCEASEAAVLERRLSTEPREWTVSLLRATGVERLLVDEGFPPPEISFGWEEMGTLAGCPAEPVLRIEWTAERTENDPVEHVRAEVASARESGYAALKTIAAYRGGLEQLPDFVLAALEENASTGRPLPVQVHTGFGDADLFLPRADPGYLKPVLERFRDTPFVLLHCWPFVREAGWLAHVYPNVYIDLGLTIPHVSRPAAALREALELAPYSKLLYSSDAVAPELSFLAARWWREALAEVLGDALPGSEAEAAGRSILRENAVALYGLA
jgi:hypothetical protein